MQMKETISCNFIDLGSAFINILLSRQIFSRVELQKWHVSRYIIVIQRSCDILLSLLEVRWLLGDREVPVGRKQNAQNILFDGWEKNLKSDNLFITDLGTWVALLSRRSWLSLRSLKNNKANYRNLMKAKIDYCIYLSKTSRVKVESDLFLHMVH